MGLIIIESAPTSRAKCGECKRKILKNTPRGAMSGRDDYNREKKYFICYKCLLERLDRVIKSQRRRRQELKKLIKKSMREIIIMELEKDGTT